MLEAGQISETGESYQSMFLTQTRLFGLNLFDFVVDTLR